MNQPWKVIFAFVAVFIAGSVFGGFFALRIRQQTVPGAGPPAVFAPPPSPPGIPLLRRFADRLDLTDAQREKLRPIVINAETELNRVREDSLRQTEGILQRVQREFRAELTVPQRRQLDRLEERQREIMRDERKKRAQQQSFGPLGPKQPGVPGRPNNPNQGPFPQGQRPNPNQPYPNQPGPGQPVPPYQPPPNQQFQNQGPQGPPPQNGPVPPAQQPQPNNPPGVN